MASSWDEDWQFYRRQALDLQRQLRATEVKIGVYWTAALNAVDGYDKRAAWYATNISKEDTEEGYQFSTLKGERVLLLQKITAAATMSTMLYLQKEAS